MFKPSADPWSDRQRVGLFHLNKLGYVCGDT
jgi:hypothetical protein